MPCARLGPPPRAGRAFSVQRAPTIQRRAAPVVVAGGLMGRVVTAAWAGAVAACVQAALFAVTEPMVNRVNVNRMSIKEAVRAVTPAMMVNHFKTTLPTSLIKAPFYEAVLTLVMAMGLPANIQGILLGFLYTTVTMPLTNFRARMSLQQDFGWNDMYVAYTPTVIRDVVGGIARTQLTNFGIQSLGWAPQSPPLMATVMLLTCLASAPFNEIRGYWLQKGKTKKSFQEFFQPMNCVRSTLIGAFNFGFALGAGYWIAPEIARLLAGLTGS